MEFTYARYNEIIEKIKQNLDEYERMGFQYNRQTLYLANGDLISIKVLKSNIAHLLGVNLDYLNQSNLFKQDMDSYSKLKYFLDNSYSFSRLVVSKKLSYESMFSDYIDEKLDSFIDNIKIRTDDMQYIVKYDGTKTYGMEPVSDICDYYIIRKISGSHYVFGVKKSEKTDDYLPVTSRKYDNYNDFEAFIERIARKQEITYPFIMKIINNSKDYKNDFYPRMTEKSVFLDTAIKVANKYGATAAVARDYNYSLSILTDEKTKRYKILSILGLLADNIKSGNVMSVDVFNSICGEIEIPEEVIGLINACNDNVCLTNNNENSSYTEISNERNELKEELIKTKEELKEKNNRYEELLKENTELNEQNSIYNEKMNIVEEAYQKIKNLHK